MDGNNSLKLIDSSYQSRKTRSNDWVLLWHCWIEAEEVDKYKNEVKNASNRKKVRMCISFQYTNLKGMSSKDSGWDIAWLNVNELEDLKGCADACVDQWKAAGPNF
jgi:hypothetical protein